MKVVESLEDMSVNELVSEYVDEKDDESMKLAFSKEYVKDRKEWLAEYDPKISVDHNIKVLSYQDFINKELI